MTVTLKNERLDVVDALRGAALLAIVLFHNLEHYNMMYGPENLPDWMIKVDKAIWDIQLFLFAGKAYATFSLLFGFSFFIQFRNAERRGIDFRWRFAWRMFLLVLFAQFHALFYNGDILLLYAVVGFLVIPVSRCSDKTLLILAVVCLLQPLEWIRILYASFNPDFVGWGSYNYTFYALVKPVMAEGSFWEVLQSNIWHGQLYSNLWQVENGRLFQTAALFMFGMLLGRKEYFVKSEGAAKMWKQVLIYSAIAFIPLYLLKTHMPGMVEVRGIKAALRIILPSLANFAFMAFLVSGFTLLWFKVNGYKAQKFLIPYGRMSLTNYISQSIIGVAIYYSFGLGLYKYTGATYSTLIAIGIFTIQMIFSRWWLSTHKQGPFEYLWKRGTWAFHKK